jgi:hypothetical protein
MMRIFTEAESDALVRGFSRAQDRGRGLRESLFAAVSEMERAQQQPVKLERDKTAT